MTGLLRPTKITIHQREIPVLISPVTLKTFKPFVPPRRKWTTEEVRSAQNKRGTFSDWSYTGPNGPEQWQQSFPVAASTYQSPVNIDKSEVKYDESIEDLILNGYEEKKTDAKLKLQNNGCTVKISLPSGITLSRDDLSSTYDALYVCFHWGKDNDEGSEHRINGNSYPMEIQVVHKNTKYNEEEMYDKQDGLLMLAYFVEIDDETNDSFKCITDQLNKIKHKDEETKINHFSLRSILPKDIDYFYHYVGSLSTPPCNECATWIILSDTVKMSQQQINNFRELLNGEDDSSASLSGNYRPVQKIYTRLVRTNNIGIYLDS